MLATTARLLRRYADRDRFCLALILAACAAALAIIPLAGVPAGRDLQQHLQFAATFHDAIARGDLFPGWAAAENQGFGSVGVRFYPPLAYYLLAATQLATGDWYTSLALNCFGWMFLGGAGVYCWTKETFGRREALFAGLLYALAPYHLFELFQALLYAEFAAFAWLPFCFWFLQRTLRGGRWPDALAFSACCAALVLTHLPLTIIGALALGVYALCFAGETQWRRALLQLAAAVTLALAASSFYWIKPAGELGWLAHNQPQYASGSFDFRQYLFPLYYSMGAPVWHFDAPILLALLMLAPLAVLLALDRRPTPARRASLALVATGAFAVFMMSAPSAFLWSRFALLQKVQFPWRWLAVATLVSLPAFAAGVVGLCRARPRARRALVYYAAAVVFAFVLFDLTQNILPSAPLSRAAFARQFDGFERNWGCSCWWPVWADRAALRRAEPVAAGGRAVEIARWDGETKEFTVAAGAAADARLALFYYPHWQAALDGRPVETRPAADGSLALALPAEETIVSLRFVEPAPVRYAQPFSLFAWLVYAALFFFLRRKPAKIETLQ